MELDSVGRVNALLEKRDKYKNKWMRESGSIVRWKHGDGMSLFAMLIVISTVVLIVCVQSGM